MLALGAPKKGDDEEAGPDSAASDEPAERELAREAYGAMKDGDEDGFVEAFIAAVKACKSKSYEADDDEE